MPKKSWRKGELQDRQLILLVRSCQRGSKLLRLPLHSSMVKLSIYWGREDCLFKKSSGKSWTIWTKLLQRKFRIKIFWTSCKPLALALLLLNLKKDTKEQRITMTALKKAEATSLLSRNLRTKRKRTSLLKSEMRWFHSTTQSSWVNLSISKKLRSLPTSFGKIDKLLLPTDSSKQ